MASKRKQYQPNSRPVLKPASESEGGATQLANLVAYALALGNHDALEISHPAVLPVGRPRSNAVAPISGLPPRIPPPVPPRPGPR